MWENVEFDVPTHDRRHYNTIEYSGDITITIPIGRLRRGARCLSFFYLHDARYPQVSK